MHEVRMKLPMEMRNICSKIAPSCTDVRIMLLHSIVYRVMHLTLFLRFFLSDGWYVPYFPLSSSKYLHRVLHSSAVDILSVWAFSVWMNESHTNVHTSERWFASFYLTSKSINFNSGWLFEVTETERSGKIYHGIGFSLLHSVCVPDPNNSVELRISH